MKQSSVLLARALSQKTKSLLVEHAVLSVNSKFVQPASLSFKCNHLQGTKNLPEWLLFDVLTLTWTANKDKDNHTSGDLRRGKATTLADG